MNCLVDRTATAAYSTLVAEPPRHPGEVFPFSTNILSPMLFFQLCEEGNSRQLKYIILSNLLQARWVESTYLGENYLKNRLVPTASVILAWLLMKVLL